MPKDFDEAEDDRSTSNWLDELDGPKESDLIDDPDTPLDPDLAALDELVESRLDDFNRRLERIEEALTDRGML